MMAEIVMMSKCEKFWCRWSRRLCCNALAESIGKVEIVERRNVITETEELDALLVAIGSLSFHEDMPLQRSFIYFNAYILGFDRLCTDDKVELLKGCVSSDPSNPSYDVLIYLNFMVTNACNDAIHYKNTLIDKCNIKYPNRYNQDIDNYVSATKNTPTVNIMLDLLS
jgi:hypothetical protein